MASTFDISGPALISFSGGRTSAYLLHRILQRGLRNDVHVVFADTGKERSETYDFVHECAARWSVQVHWVRRPSPEGVLPFEQLITDRGYLPNPIMRMCTTELKIRPMKRFMLDRGYEEWTMVLGIRADEPLRAAKLLAPTKERWDHRLPLYRAGITEAHVMKFWSTQPFDLALRPHEGNCDLCFLKTLTKRLDIVREHPDFVDWWARQEERTGQQFKAATKSRKGEPPYRSLPMLARASSSSSQGAEEGGSVDCVCHD
ncbi:MAG: phosphoadenosine phosphosulfate reductase family protein [Myxococcales bacterium]|nr:phosphoadenosine phosphosulfate reductase family protein [Myxococcales bacterium]